MSNKKNNTVNAVKHGSFFTVNMFIFNLNKAILVICYKYKYYLIINNNNNKIIIIN